MTEATTTDTVTKHMVRRRLLDGLARREENAGREVLARISEIEEGRA